MKVYKLFCKWECKNPKCGQSGVANEELDEDEEPKSFKFCPYCGSKVSVSAKELSAIGE